MRHQPRVRGGHDSVSSGVKQEVRRELDRTARMFNCSRSWVIDVALAETLGVKLAEAEHYDRGTRVKRFKKSA